MTAREAKQLVCLAVANFCGGDTLFVDLLEDESDIDRIAEAQGEIYDEMFRRGVNAWPRLRKLQGQ